nr:olfactory receptor 13A1-like [Dasypus novemcinctus]
MVRASCSHGFLSYLELQDTFLDPPPSSLGFQTSCTSTVIPKLLENLLGRSSTISYGGCLTQLFFLSWILGAELLLLTVMAYDRCMAICQPLHYHTLMSRPLCALLVGSVWAVLNFLLTMVSYAFIIASILRIRSAEGKRRAFSTCSSHLLVVCMSYSTLIYTYILPGFGSSVENGKVVTILYMAVSPSLNPLIYTLRNKDVKVALRRVFSTFGK